MSAQKSARLGVVADVRPSGVDKKTVDGELPVRLCNYTDIYYGDRITTGQQFMAASATLAEVRSFSLRRGDVVITKDSETADDIAAAAYIDEDLPGVLLGYHCALIRPKTGVEGRFLYWLLQSSYMRDYFAQHARGVTRVGLRQEDIARAPVPLPTLAVQRRIAGQLDEEVAQIARVVAKNEQMTALLAERMTAVAWSALPEWPTMPLKRLLSSVRGGEWGVDPGRAEVDARCYRAADFDRPWHVLQSHSAPLRGLTRQQLTANALQPGDLILEKSGGGPRTPVGCAVRVRREDVAEMPAVATNFTARLRPAPGVVPEYLQILLAAYYRTGALMPFIKQTTGLQNVDMSAFLQQRVPGPNFSEQRRVAHHVFKEWKSIDDVHGRLTRQNSLLAERRQALITAAVTGQLDLGEAA